MKEIEEKKSDAAYWFKELEIIFVLFSKKLMAHYSKEKSGNIREKAEEK